MNSNRTGPSPFAAVAQKWAVGVGVWSCSHTLLAGGRTSLLGHKFDAEDAKTNDNQKKARSNYKRRQRRCWCCCCRCRLSPGRRHSRKPFRYIVSICRLLLLLLLLLLLRMEASVNSFRVDLRCVLRPFLEAVDVNN